MSINSYLSCSFTPEYSLSEFRIYDMDVDVVDCFNTEAVELPSDYNNDILRAMSNPFVRYYEQGFRICV